MIASHPKIGTALLNPTPGQLQVALAQPPLCLLKLQFIPEPTSHCAQIAGSILLQKLPLRLDPLPLLTSDLLHKWT
jgi:hypothetical protein